VNDSTTPASPFGPYKALTATVALGAFVATGALICARNADAVTDPGFLFGSTLFACGNAFGAGTLFKLGGIAGELIEAIDTIKSKDTSHQGDGVRHGVKGFVAGMALTVAGLIPALYVTDKSSQEAAQHLREKKAKTEFPAANTLKPS
jgi:hypothetical protein